MSSEHDKIVQFAADTAFQIVCDQLRYNGLSDKEAKSRNIEKRSPTDAAHLVRNSIMQAMSRPGKFETERSGDVRVTNEIEELFSLVHDLVQEAKGGGGNEAYVTSHLDEAENWLWKIEEALTTSREPTPDMVKAGLQSAIDFMQESGVDGLSPFSEYPSPSENIKRTYRAMIAAAPSSPVTGGVGEQYVVWSHEHSAWWKPDHRGYTLHVEKAGTYSRDEALKICRTRGGGWGPGDTPYELPVRVSDLPEFARTALNSEGR